MPEDTEPEPNIDSDEDSTTKSTRTRWEWTGTILAFAMVLSLPMIIGLTAAGVLTLSPISQAWFGLYFTVTLMAATWAFGKETLEAVREARGKDTGGN